MLQSLQYIDNGGAVQLKGRVACQISSHELLLTELLFENALSPLAPEESAALLSCLVFTQNTQVEPHITNTLKEVRQVVYLCCSLVKLCQKKKRSTTSCMWSCPVPASVELP